MKNVKNQELLLSILIPVVVLIVLILLLLTFTYWLPKKKVVYKTLTCNSDTDCLNDGLCDVTTQTCTCPETWTGDRCDIWKNPTAPNQNVINCSTTALPCTTNTDCQKCTDYTLVDFTCQNVTESNTDYGVSGNFCLPAKPNTSACWDYECDPSTTNCSNQMPGRWYWQGWQDVETMAWNCDCEYSDYYPQEQSTSACIKSGDLCKHGTWTYPCVQDTNNPSQCTPPTKEQMGSSPIINGKCTCVNNPCLNDSDCVSTCILCNGRSCNSDKDCTEYCQAGAVCDSITKTCIGTAATGISGNCANQKTGFNNEGIPTCVTDMCPVECAKVTCTKNSDCDNGCQSGATCNVSTGYCKGNNLINPGEWVMLEKPPYTYGYCKCPPNCVATENQCIC